MPLLPGEAPTSARQPLQKRKPLHENNDAGVSLFANVRKKLGATRVLVTKTTSPPRRAPSRNLVDARREDTAARLGEREGRPHKRFTRQIDHGYYAVVRPAILLVLMLDIANAPALCITMHRK